MIHEHFQDFHLDINSYELLSLPDFLGRTEVRIKDILKETHQTRGPIIKRLLLHEVETGEVIVKLDLQLYERDT